MPPIIVWVVAAALEIAPIATGWTLIDEFAGRFVYFYTGYIFAPHIFRLARHAEAVPTRAMVALALWALVNGILVFTGSAELPMLVARARDGGSSGDRLHFGAAGQERIVGLLALLRASFDRHLSGFFLPMAATRVLLLKTGIIADIGTMSLIVTRRRRRRSAPALLARARTGLRFLFERPEGFWLTSKPRTALQPAEKLIPETFGAGARQALLMGARDPTFEHPCPQRLPLAR